MTEKERYATVGTWIKVFEKEGSSLRQPYINKKIKEAGLIGKTARNKVGRVMRNAFYPESSIRKLCADQLEHLPQADDSGFIVRDDEKYGTSTSLSRALGISNSYIQDRIRQVALPILRGRSKKGRVSLFYSISDVRAICRDQLEDLPQVDSNGLLEIDGCKFFTINQLARLLGISETPVRARIACSTLNAVRGRSIDCRIFDFYSFDEVQLLCADLLGELPVADEEGFVEVGGETYGTKFSISKRFGIANGTARARIKEADLSPIRAKTMQGIVKHFYSVEGARRLFLDLIEVPRADESGLITKGGTVYGTCKAIAYLIAVSESCVQSRVRMSSPDFVRGKDVRGHVLNFYSVSDVRDLCEDLISLPQADEGGFLKKGGKKYGHIKGLSQQLGVSFSTLHRRVVKSDLSSIQGLDAWNRVGDFYALNEVVMLCADLTQDIPQAEGDGFFEIDGKRYGTLKRISNALGISSSSLIAQVPKSELNAVRGKNRVGRIYDFYCLVEVEQLFADLVAKKTKKKP